MDRSADEIAYKEVWHAVLSNVLNYSDAQIHEWMMKVGTPLLADPSVVFHEEAWFWVCGQVVSEFGSNVEKLDFHKAESNVFSALREACESENADWDETRRRCQIAVKPT